MRSFAFDSKHDPTVSMNSEDRVHMKFAALETRLNNLEDLFNLPAEVAAIRQSKSWHAGDRIPRVILPGEKVRTIGGEEGTVDRYIRKTQKYRIRTSSGIVKLDSSEVSLSEFDDIGGEEMSLPFNCSPTVSDKRDPASQSNLMARTPISRDLRRFSLKRALRDDDTFRDHNLRDFENRLMKRLNVLMDQKIHKCKKEIFDKLEEGSLEAGRRRKEIEGIIHDVFRESLVHEVQDVCSSIFAHKKSASSIQANSDESVNVRFLSCYHGKLTRIEAERRLKIQHTAGRYLIRDSKNYLVLSILTSNLEPFSFYHIRLHQKQSKYALDSGGDPILPFREWKKIINPDAPCKLSSTLTHPVRNPGSTNVYRGKLGEQIRLQRNTLEDIFRIDTISNCISDFAGWIVNMDQLELLTKDPLIADILASLQVHDMKYTYVDTKRYDFTAICSLLNTDEKEIYLKFSEEKKVIQLYVQTEVSVSVNRRSPVKQNWKRAARFDRDVELNSKGTGFNLTWKSQTTRKWFFGDMFQSSDVLVDCLFESLMTYIPTLPPMVCEL